MATRSESWESSSEQELKNDLARYLIQASVPSCTVRLFFKVGPALIYGGCNRQFASDAGLSGPADIVGLDDFSPQLSWVAQAAKYRRDDREVMDRGRPKLGIIERQSSASGIIWLDTSKVPVIDDGKSIGIFGAYEVIDAKIATVRSSQRRR